MKRALALLLASVASVTAVWPAGAVENKAEILAELAEFLAIPNVASDSVNIRRNAAHLITLLKKRGIRARLLESPGSPPAVFGERRSPGARKTIVLYSHYDGQPAVASKWTSDPWTPLLREGALESGAPDLPMPVSGDAIDGEWRLYARSASDDKAPIIAMLAALDGLAAAGRAPSVHLKFFFEGEEEAGSPHLREMLERHRELLAADLWIFCDGPMHQSRRPQIVFGVRGALGLQLTIYGATRSLHSGHYGNWAPNPIALLQELLGSMRDADGRILIDGFLDDVTPFSPAERAALSSVPDPDVELRAALGLAASEAGNARLAERIMKPAINFKGVRSGQVGDQAKNSIPTEAHAAIGFRMVPDQTPARVRAQVETHVRGLGFHIVREDPDTETRRTHTRIAKLTWGRGYPAYRSALDAAGARAVVRVVEDFAGGQVIQMPTLGGSLPLYLFREVLDADVIVLPIVNHDNNQHAPDENLRLQNLWDGIEMYSELIANLGNVWR